MLSSSKTGQVFCALALLLQSFHFSCGANILFFFGLGSYSHLVTMYPLADSLAKRGHHVIFMSPHHHRGPYINPNITHIVPTAVHNYMYGEHMQDFDVNQRISKSFGRLADTLLPMALKTCQQYFESSELPEFYEKTKTLDLVMIDNCNSECGAAIAYKYGAKIVVFHTVIHFPHEYDRWGLVPESSAIPELDIDPVKTPMSFWGRVRNTYIALDFRWKHYKYMQQLDALARKHLKDDSIPFLDDIMRNTSLNLYTGDVVSDYPRSHGPLFVDVGGLYCQNETKPLPAEILKFIDADSKSDGFVYISLGSVVVASNLPESIVEVFMHTVRQFSRLRFIWKWEGQVPGNKPSNLYLNKWLPQHDILAHPKLKAFVTQAGRPSTLEALCNGVPMISFPVLGDQDNNAQRMNVVGANVVLELGTVTKEQFVAAIQQTAYNPRMKERLVELQNILLDRPMSAMDTALWWTEYVIRHKNTDHLKPAGFDQWWFQRRLLDVWLFAFTVLLILLVGLVKTGIRLVHFVRETSTKKLKVS